MGAGRVAAALVAAIAGCAIVGPASIRGSRMAYNDAIVATNDQQVLAMIVRMRYGESSGLLAVSSVTASMRIQANASGNVGIGPTSNYEGNLVPLGVGASYEENPTISYVPVQGEKYLRQTLSPLPLDLTVLLLNALRDSPCAMTLLVERINGIRNPRFLAGPGAEPDPRFARVADLLAEMGRDEDVLWTADTTGHSLVLRSEGEGVAPRVKDVCDLLGFRPPEPVGGVLTIPVVLGVGKPSVPAVNLKTRSLWDLLQIAAASVDVPSNELESGTAPPIPAAGAAGRSIRIRCSGSAPDDAVTAIRHHGSWFYIEATDAESKETFRILQALISSSLAEAADREKATPVLTVPVSR
jgi:hypothetical protein